MKKILAMMLTVAIVVSSLYCVNLGIVSASTEITTNGNGGATDVGAWFTTYNTTAFWNHRFSDPNVAAVGYKALLSDGTYGIPQSGSVAEIDYQIEKMAEAGIDFILFDLTNGGLSDAFTYGMDTGLAFVLNNAKLTCERLAVWNETHRWQIKYAVGIGVYSALRSTYITDAESGTTETVDIGTAIELQAQAVYEQFIENEVYGKYYYQFDGLPLLVLHNLSQGNALTCSGGWDSYTGTKTYGNSFSLKHSNSVADAGSWGWLTKGAVSDENNCGAVVDEEVMLVCPGQWNHAADSTPNAAREKGQHYAQNWKAAIAQKPRVVMISSLNDYMEDTAVWPTDTSACTVEEQWYNENNELDPNMYWDMTVNYIDQLRTDNGDSVLTAEQRVSDNLVLGMTPTTKYTNTDITRITDGVNAYEGSVNANTLYGASTTNSHEANETYYQFDFGSATVLNQIKLYLYTGESDRRPQDIAVDVKLADGTWKRVATRYQIAYSGTNAENITVDADKDGVVESSHLEFSFAAEECMAFRLTANRQRVRATNSSYTSSTLNWMLTEIEAYYDTTITDYTGIEDVDDATYAILNMEERLPSSGKTVTTNSTRGTNTGLDLITDGLDNTVNDVIVYYVLADNTTLLDTIWLDIEFDAAEPINRVDITRWLETAGTYWKRSSKDMAIDVLEPDGKYTRVVEVHEMSEIGAPSSSNTVKEFLYYFPTTVAKGIRITFHKAQDEAFSSGNSSKPLVSPSEIEAYYDATVTTSMYTGITAATEGQGEIPEYASANYALDGVITSSNTNTTFSSSYPVSRLNDGKNTRDDDCGIINYMSNNLAWYQLSFDGDRTVNEVKLCFSKYEPAVLPQDIGVDVLVNGIWKRVADLHNRSYGLAGDSTLAPADQCMDITFSVVDCEAIRVVASKSRNSSSNFRMVEIECYYNPEVSTYTGMEALDDITYASTVTGDANLDFVTDVTDFEMIREKLLGRWTSYIFDVRYDSVIDIRDLVLTKKQL